MINALCVEKARTSKLKRVRFLPRFALTVEVGGTKISYRQVPLIETLWNLAGKKWNMKNFMNVAMKQLQEVDLPKVKLSECTKAKPRV